VRGEVGDTAAITGGFASVCSLTRARAGAGLACETRLRPGGRARAYEYVPVRSPCPKDRALAPWVRARARRRLRGHGGGTKLTACTRSGRAKKAGQQAMVHVRRRWQRPLQSVRHGSKASTQSSVDRAAARRGQQANSRAR
jgi:hypothetical protein